MSMKNIDDATQHDALARLAAAKPHTATDRPDDFIAAAIANSDVLAASVKSPKHRVRSLTFAAVAAVCIVSASVAGPGLITASNQPSQMTTDAIRGDISAAAAEATADFPPFSAGGHGWVLSTEIPWGFEVPAYFDYSLAADAESAGSSLHVYQEVPLKNSWTIVNQLRGQLGLQNQKPIRKYFFNHNISLTFPDTLISRNQSNEAMLQVSAIGHSAVEYWKFARVVAGAKLPSESFAKGVVAKFLTGVGLKVASPGTSVDGAYRIEVVDTSKNTNYVARFKGLSTSYPKIYKRETRDLQVRATLLANGQPTAVGVTFTWTHRNGHLNGIRGTLATLKDLGLKQTLSASQVVNRIGQVDGSWIDGLDRDGLIYSSKTTNGMGQKLWDELVACKKVSSKHCNYKMVKYQGKLRPLLPVTATRVEPAMLEAFSMGKALLIPGYYYYDSSGFIGETESLSEKDFKVPPARSAGWDIPSTARITTE